MSIFPSDTATKLIESLTGVIGANIPIIVALLGFIRSFLFSVDLFLTELSKNAKRCL